MLELLGWDSKSWKINTGQDVKTGKKPDIVLKSGSSKILVIESKDASRKDMLDGAYQNKTFTEQLFGYCQGEGLSWGVLTNFVEWRLYSSYRKILYKNIKYAFHDLLWEGADKNDYIDLLSEEGLFFLSKISKENLSAKLGKIDSDPVYYPEQLDLAVKKVKEEFFSKIKNWRSQLKKYIERNYPHYGANEIDLMAQQIIDRMIFIDICHDKGVISENHIKSVLSSRLLKFEELKEKFRLMNDKFDTELFDRSECDEIKINDLVMVPVIEELDEIDFSKLSANIIGEVYENYLKELQGSSAKESEAVARKQHEKRKNKGIYYTKDYIVDYIVENTVGELLRKVKTEGELEKIKVIDPACGSGSFLIRVFDEFLKAYRRILKVPEGQTTLDEFSYRRKILQNNIFGVDLDERAVEITKLNLMIKAIDKVKPRDMEGAHLLPNLSLNIRCGNSLIGGEKINDLDLVGEYEKEISRLVELKEKFYHEKDGGGRDAMLDEIKTLENVIDRNLNDGLDEYFKNKDKFKPFNYKVSFCEIFKDGGFDVVVGNPPYGAEVSDSEKSFYQQNFNVGSSDTAILFIQRFFDILSDKGKFGFIVPKAFCFASNYEKIRERVWNHLEQLVDCGKAWTEVKLEQIIFIIDKSRKIRKYLSANFKNKQLNILGNIDKADAKKFGFFLNSVTPAEVEVAKKIYKAGGFLNDIAHNRRGLILNKFIENGKYPVIGCKEIDRYKIRKIRGYINNDLSGTNAEIYDNSVLVQGIVAHIENPVDHIKLIANIPDKKIYFLADNINQLVVNRDYSNYFIWAILNSQLMNWYAYRFIYGKSIRTMRFDNPVTSRLPFPKATKQEQELLIQKAKEILKLAKQKENEDKISAVNYEIDQIIYKLYGLSKEEIKIIEGVT